MNIKRFNSYGDEIKPGLRQRHQTNFETIKFDYHVILDDVQPDRWHGEVSLKGKTILRTGEYPNETAAGKAAEDALLERLIDLLATNAGTSE